MSGFLPADLSAVTHHPPQLSPDLHDEILGNLHKLSFTSMGGEVSSATTSLTMAQGAASHQGTKHHFTKGGRLVANKQIVYSIMEERGLQPVGTSI